MEPLWVSETCEVIGVKYHCSTEYLSEYGGCDWFYFLELPERKCLAHETVTHIQYSVYYQCSQVE